MGSSDWLNATRGRWRFVASCAARSPRVSSFRSASTTAPGWDKQTVARHQLSPGGKASGLLLLHDLKARVPVLVLGPTPVDEAVMPYAGMLHFSSACARQYGSLIEEACLETDVPLSSPYGRPALV